MAGTQIQMKFTKNYPEFPFNIWPFLSNCIHEYSVYNDHSLLHHLSCCLDVFVITYKSTVRLSSALLPFYMKMHILRTDTQKYQEKIIFDQGSYLAVN